MLDWKDFGTTRPEDVLPIKTKKHQGMPDTRKTEYVLVIREHRERPDCACRVELDGKWYWSDGDGISKVTHWATFNRPYEWDAKAHEEYLKNAVWRNKKGGE